MEIFHSEIFILLLIFCYEILTQYEETYEHQNVIRCNYDLPKIKSIDIKYLKHIKMLV